MVKSVYLDYETIVDWLSVIGCQCSVNTYVSTWNDLVSPGTRIITLLQEQ
jgi:hypothetical protein